MAIILMHKMLVEARLQKDEVEDGSMYTVIDMTIKPDFSVHYTHFSVDDVVSQSDSDSENANEV